MTESLRRAAFLSAFSLLAVACADDGDPRSEPDVRTDTGDVGSDADADADTTAQTDAADAADAALDTEVGPGCIGSTTVLYDPFESAELLLWPDDVNTYDDPSSPTGVRVSLAAETTPWLVQVPDLLQPVAADMETLSGFGANAAIVLRFSGPPASLPASETASLSSDALLLFDLSTDPPSRVPYEVQTSDEGRDLIVWPLRPLRLGARHAMVATTSLRDDGGACVGPSETTRRLLAGDVSGERETRLAERWVDALGATGLAADAIAGMTVFTVHDDLGPVLEAAAAIREGEPPAWAAPAECDGGNPRRCELRVTVHDFRADRYVSSPEPVGDWELNVTVWLPDGPGPFPYLVFGHGIGSDRGSGGSPARAVAPAGFAVVAVDALAHGEHPTQDGASALNATTFLGIDLQTLEIDPLSLRGNFDQTNLDRLQVVEAIRANPDIDGDGDDDLDPSRFGYFGISLGGMLGSGFSALSRDVGASILSVAGGRLLQFATDTRYVAPLMPLIANMVGSEELLQRLIPLAQCIVDPADPATWGTLVLAGDDPPNVLFPVALFDDTVPPATGRALARAIGLPQVGEPFYDVEVIGAADTPLTGNVGGGTATAAYMQYDRVTRGDAVEAATHDNVPLSPEAVEQTLHFLATWLEDGAAEIIDPYAVLATPALPIESP